MKLSPQVAQGIMQVVAPVVPSCPAVISGKSYLAVGWDATTLYAYRYVDGAYQETLATKTFAAAGLSGGFGVGGPGFHKQSGSGRVVVFVGQTTAGRSCVVSWDVDANTVALNETVADNFDLVAMLLVGSTVYACATFSGFGSGAYCYPVTCSVGASGANGAGFTHPLGTQGGGDPEPGWPWFWRAADTDGSETPGGSLSGALFAAAASLVALLGFPDSVTGGGFYDLVPGSLNPNRYATPLRWWDLAVTPGFMEAVQGSPFGLHCLFVSDVNNAGNETLRRAPAGLGSEVALWPTAWTDNGWGQARSNAAATEMSMFIAGVEDWLVRLLLVDYSGVDAGSCPLPHHVVEAPPSGSVDEMFPLD